jgi:hypothetical protein
LESFAHHVIETLGGRINRWVNNHDVPRSPDELLNALASRKGNACSECKMALLALAG